jgi:hypothetical protein
MPKTALDGLAVVEGGADLVDVGAVAADELVELVAGDAKLFGPVGDVGGHFRVNLFGVVRALGDAVFVEGVGFGTFGSAVVLGHGMHPLFVSLGLMIKACVEMYSTWQASRSMSCCAE